MMDNTAVNSLREAVRGTASELKRVNSIIRGEILTLKGRSQEISQRIEAARNQDSLPAPEFSDTEIQEWQTIVKEGLTWMQGNDTGASSKAMVRAILGTESGQSTIVAYPHDPGDLGRCLRLIEKHPWAERALPILAKQCPIWARFAAVWPTLKRYYLARRRSVLYDAIKGVINGDGLPF